MPGGCLSTLPWTTLSKAPFVLIRALGTCLFPRRIGMGGMGFWNGLSHDPPRRIESALEPMAMAGTTMPLKEGIKACGLKSEGGGLPSA